MSKLFGAFIESDEILASDLNLDAGLIQESVEVAMIANNGATNDTVSPATSARFYNFFTFPGTGKLYYPTGIEWKNGTVVAGNVICGIDIVNASPPTLAPVFNQAFSMESVQAGASAVQRVSIFERCIFRDTDLIGVWVQFSNATARRRTATVAPSNMRKNITYTNIVARMENTAWVSATEQPYLKLYYREFK